MVPAQGLVRLSSDVRVKVQLVRTCLSLKDSSTVACLGGWQVSVGKLVSLMRKLAFHGAVPTQTSPDGDMGETRVFAVSLHLYPSTLLMLNWYSLN